MALQTARKPQRVAAAPTRGRTTATASPGSTQADQAAVAQIAYALFLARDGEHGHDLEDWLRAEQLVRAKGR